MSVATSAAAPSLTDADLAEAVAELARIYLEVERGLRPRQHLARWLTPDAYLRQHDTRLSRHPDAGPVRSTDVRRVRLCRLANDRVHAVAVAREHGDHWGALILELARSARGRWQVDDIARLPDRLRMHLPPEREPEETDAAARRLRNNQIDLQLVQTVEASVRARLEKAETNLRRIEAKLPEPSELRAGWLLPDDIILHKDRWVRVEAMKKTSAAIRVTIAHGDQLELARDKTAKVFRGLDPDFDAAVRLATATRQKTAEELTHWRYQARQLAAEADQLFTAPTAVPVPGTEVLGTTPPRYLIDLLGPLPGEQDASHTTWLAAAAVVLLYREEWSIHDPELPLGEPVSDPGQQEARDRTIERLRTLTARLALQRAQEPATDRGLELRTPELGLG